MMKNLGYGFYYDSFERSLLKNGIEQSLDKPLMEK